METLLVAPGPVTTVTLNRPDVRNALSDVMIAELADVAGRLAAEPGIRVVVLRGAGPAFSAGADLRWMARQADATREENLADARRAARMFHALDALPMPVVGRIHGPALGGGAGLAAICDVVVATPAAVFGFPEVTVGLLPALIAPYVIRKIGVSGARAVFLTGERLTAERAAALGLVHEIADAATIDAAIERVTAQVLRASPSAVSAAKRLIARVAGRSPGDVLALTVEAIADQRVSPEGQEGARAFLEKRPPAWIR
ncbi:MAG: enoyl-CoA hydratase/isomerase family protein [Acidobacteria bacterium]|nr:enoyl-CoA hydratase/isomerase family protein [Acidobacteriota bacterium]